MRVLTNLHQKRVKNEDIGAKSSGGLSTNDEKFAQHLRAAIANNGMDARSYLGNKFRTMAKETGQAKGTRDEQQQHKMDWMKKELRKVEDKKIHMREFKRIDVTKGTYMNFARLVKHFGGFQSSEAILGACTASTKCIGLGPPWVVQHPQSQLTEFLILEVSWSEEFTEAWQLFKNYTKEGDAAESGAVAPEVSVDPSPRKPKAKAKAALVKNKDGEDDTSKDPAKNKYKLLWKQSCKLKMEMENAQSRALTLKRYISSDSHWSWAKSTEEPKLDAAMGAVDGGLSEWSRQFMADKEYGALKKNHTAEKMMVEMENFVRLEPNVKGLSKFVSRLLEANEALQQ
jgi:hypothetical protein